MKFSNDVDWAKLAAAPDIAIPPALAEAGELVRAVSVAQTPVETGRLAGSAAVNVVSDDKVSITYDGPYDRYQHERTDLKHEHGNSHFLGNATRSEKDNVLKIITRRLRQAL